MVQAYNNSVSAATGLAPNEIHLGRMPRLPMTVIDECVVKGHTAYPSLGHHPTEGGCAGGD